MNTSTTSLIFRRQPPHAASSGLSIPDINIWMALAATEHPHSGAAAHWWQQQLGLIAFVRHSQLGFLRLTTTAAAMAGKPLTIFQAWSAYDRFFDDERVTFLPEPNEVERQFRANAPLHNSSPKVWADAWMLALAETAGGTLVTFDKALGQRGANCLLDHRP
jgi:toxin-antitoxin system PIN domain toxin